MWTAARQVNIPREFCPQYQASQDSPEVVTPPETNSEHENIGRRNVVGEEIEAPAVESQDEQSDAGMKRDRPKRVRRPRRVYTYDKLSQPTL